MKSLALNCVMTLAVFVQVLLVEPPELRAAEGAPLGVGLLRCRPHVIYSGVDCTDLPPDAGLGNSPAEREYEVELVYHHDGADVDAAIAKIARIEICWLEVEPSSNQVRGHCPGSGK